MRHKIPSPVLKRLAGAEAESTGNEVSQILQYRDGPQPGLAAPILCGKMRPQNRRKRSVGAANLKLSPQTLVWAGRHEPPLIVCVRVLSWGGQTLWFPSWYPFLFALRGGDIARNALLHAHALDTHTQLPIQNQAACGFPVLNDDALRPRAYSSGPQY